MPLALDSEEYRLRTQKELAEYRSCGDVHELPSIFHYWSNAYLRPQLQTFGYDSIEDFFLQALLAPFKAQDAAPLRFLSVAAGNCDLEVRLAAALVGAGKDRFVFDCFDLNEAMLSRGAQLAREQSVETYFRFVVADMNSWRADAPYDVVIANQSLHHVVNLEGLLAEIKRSLGPHGRFAISDMIGGNGHVRGPRAVDLIQRYWAELPPSYRFNRAYCRYEERYVNRDHSAEGFEGIRAADILPLLAREFQFEFFFPFANIVDAFVDRAIGEHLDPARPWDRHFIDRVHAADAEAIAAGQIRPTHLLALAGLAAPPCARYPGHLTPSFCLGISESEAIAPTPVEPHGWDPGLWNSLAEAAALSSALMQSQERSDRAARLAVRLDTELSERNLWALRLDREIEELSALLQQANARDVEKTEWALRLNAELEELRALLADSQKELQRRTEWAIDLDRQLAERTVWALQMERELEKLQSRLRKLQERPLFEAMRSLRRRIF